MPASFTFQTGTVLAFVLVLARVGGALSFVPLPGFSAASGQARTILVLAITLALYPVWPAAPASAATPGTLAAWAVAEAVVGLAIGVAVAILLEAFLLSAQVLGLQAGYAYAQTVDPNTQADSGILLVFAQLIAGLCFFALGLDREMVRLFAQSLSAIPPGAYVFGPRAGEVAIHMGSLIFSVGVRLALPVVALLVMVDVALALLGRLNAQLQLISLAFPMKMLIALAVLTWIASLYPRILRELGAVAFAACRRMLGI